MQDKRITEWLPVNGERFDSQYGRVNNADWCEHEAARILLKGGQPYIDRRGIKGDKEEICVCRRDCPNRLPYEKGKRPLQL